jgi:hypothetical protein
MSQWLQNLAHARVKKLIFGDLGITEARQIGDGYITNENCSMRGGFTTDPLGDIPYSEVDRISDFIP